MIDEVEMYILEKAGVDLEIVLERFSNNTGVYLKFVNKFAQNKSYSLFLEYLKNGERQKAADELHNIKGLSGNLGFDKLFAITDKLMYKLRSEEKDEFEEILAEFCKQYEDVIDIINK